MKSKNLLSKIFMLATAVCLTGSVYAQCPSNMISYWRLQENGGSKFADERNNHDAMASASPSQVAGISGKGQSFSGASYLSIPSHSDFNWASNASFSIELWVKYSNSNPTEVFIGRDDPTTQTHWWIGKNETGQIEWYVRASDGSNGDIVATANTNNGQWHHIVAVRNGSNSRQYLYVDGVLQNAGGTLVSLSSSLSSTADVTIGNMIYNNNPMYYLNGSLDEIAIYNAALTSDDVTAHYNNIKNYQIGYCSGNAVELFSEPNTKAVISQPYTYDLDGSGNPVPTYTLVKGPQGMTIDANTGVLSWTPASFSQNAPVVVRASNTGGNVEQSFNIFLADAPSCRSNLIAYWNFDNQSSSPFYDNIANYELSGNAGRTTGRLGSGLVFDGINDSVNMDDLAEPAKVFFDFDDVPNFSIELWMKSSAVPTQTMVLFGRDEDANNTQYWLGVTPEGVVNLYLRDYYSTPHEITLEGGSVLDGAWHHIVATYNSGSDNVRLYIDKVMVDEGVQNFGNFGGNDDLNIGCLNTILDKFWYEGLIDELAIYNTELSEATITNNYNEVMAGNGACVLNFAPLVLSNPVLTATEDAQYSYNIVTSDINPDDVLGISAVTKPAWLTLTYTPGDSTATLSGTPDNSQVGTHNVVIRVTDGSLNVDQSFQITVANVNDAPAFSSSPLLTVNEDSEYSYVPTASDVDANSVLTFSAPELPDWLTFNAETNTLSGTPNNDHVGLWNVVLSVSDGTASVDQDFQITVNNVNDAPVITSTPEDSIRVPNSYLYELVAEDVDEGDELVYSAEVLPDWLTFTAGSNSGILTGAPGAGDVGTHAVILKVNDGHGDVVQAFSIVVTAQVPVQEIDNSIMNKVYPSPATSNVYFRFAENSRCKVELFDVSGKLHKQVSSDNGFVEMNVSGLSNGVYVYKAYQNNKISVGKITKE